MTDPNLPSGTDRVYAAFNLLKNKNNYEIVSDFFDAQKLIKNLIKELLFLH